MIFCSNCGTQAEESAAFCPNCGTGLSPTERVVEEIPYSAAPALPATYLPQVETKGRRVLAYLIDIVPLLFLALVHLLPVFGWMLYGLIHLCYWLLRDMGGASPGKMVVGSFVGDLNGGVSSTSQRMLRNVPLAIPGLLGMIPLLGIFFEFGVALFIFGGEAILLLATGRRFGDRLAGTDVFRR